MTWWRYKEANFLWFFLYLYPMLCSGFMCFKITKSESFLFIFVYSYSNTWGRKKIEEKASKQRRESKSKRQGICHGRSRAIERVRVLFCMSLIGNLSTPCRGRQSIMGDEGGEQPWTASSELWVRLPTTCANYPIGETLACSRPWTVWNWSTSIFFLWFYYSV